MSKKPMKGRPGRGPAPKKGKKQQLPEVQSNGSSSENDAMNMEEQNSMGIEQLTLTVEELEKNHTKTLSFDNPNAPANIALYSWKDRQFKVDEMVDHLMIHYRFDGDILKENSEECHDQETFWDDKKQAN